MQEEEDTGWWSEPIVLRLDDDGDYGDGDDDGLPTCKRRRTKDGRVSKLF